MSINQEFNSSSSSGEDNFTNFEELSNFKLLIRKWAAEFNIPLIALNGLLCILKSHKCFNSLPKDSRTLMHTKPIDNSCLYIVEPGTYYHFGITNSISQNFSNYLLNNSNFIDIVVGIDGLPLFKSSPKQFWPILAYIRPNKDNVFPIGIYCGEEKPANSNIFFK